MLTVNKPFGVEDAFSPSARKVVFRRFLRSFGILAAQVIVCVGIVGGGTYAFANFVEDSEYFRVQYIRVEGVRALDEHDVAQVSGVTRNDNLVWLNTAAIRETVESLPYVRTARITREFPGRVIIAVEERSPFVALQVRSQLYAIDAEGVVLRELGDYELPPGPIVSGVPSLGNVAPGDRVEAAPLRRALDLWGIFTQTRLAGQVTVSEIWASHINDLRMYCDELPFEIRWGRHGLAEQAVQLDFLWEQKDGELECQEYLDLRWGRDIACR